MVDKPISIEVSASVLLWIFRTCTNLIQDGTGNNFVDDRETDRGAGPGLIDEIPADTETHRYVGWLIHFLRTIREIARLAIEKNKENLDPSMFDYPKYPTGDLDPDNTGLGV